MVSDCVNAVGGIFAVRWRSKAWICAHCTPLHCKLTPILFIPVNCGTTGNCMWRLYDSKRHTFLGEIWGQFLYVPVKNSAWPRIVTYGHESVCSGSLARFEFRSGQYRLIGNYYAINECIPNGTPLPRQFARARRLCDCYGS